MVSFEKERLEGFALKNHIYFQNFLALSLAEHEVHQDTLSTLTLSLVFLRYEKNQAVTWFSQFDVSANPFLFLSFLSFSFVGR